MWVKDVIEVVDQGPIGPAPDLRDGDLDGLESMDLSLPLKKGRPKRAVCKERLADVIRMYFLEKLSMRQIADIIGVSHMSVYRMLSDPSVELLI